MANELSFRKATAADDAAKIAKYLHLTDAYIYPVIAENPDDADFARFVASCLAAKNNFYSREHISVALSAGEIIGVACVVRCGVPLSFSEGLWVPPSLKTGVKTVEESYFAPLSKENEGFTGHNLINICVDEAYRGQGVGRAFMAYLLSLYGEGQMHLDVVASNAAAIHTYEKCGFAVTKEYLGFSGKDMSLPCFHMLRPAKSK